MQTSELDDRTLVLSLGGQICPACGKAKRKAETMCASDYHRLTRGMQFALYRKVGSGYREAVIAALQFLDVAEPHLAEPVQARTEPDARPGGMTPPAGLFG